MIELQDGIALFNVGRFFDAHEALEDVWRALPVPSDAKRHLQGLVQLAVAFHHESRGNLRGARSVLDRAVQNLSGAEASFSDLDFGRLRRDMAIWQDYLAGSGPRPASPRIRTLKPES